MKTLPSPAGTAALALVLALALAPRGAWAVDRKADAEAALVVTATPLAKPVPPGLAAQARLIVEIKGDASHHWGAPFSVAVTATAPLVPAKAALARTDARDPAKDADAKRLEFDVPFKAAARGTGRLSAEVSLWVCFPDECIPVTRSVAWDVRAE